MSQATDDEKITNVMDEKELKIDGIQFADPNVQDVDNMSVVTDSPSERYINYIRINIL